MHQTTILAIMVIFALVMFIMITRTDSFAVATYGDYLNSLKDAGEPYGRVYGRDSYQVVKAARDQEEAVRRLREWP